MAVSPQVCFAIWTSMMNIHALRNTAGDKATAQPTSGNIQMFISIYNFKKFFIVCHTQIELKDLQKARQLDQVQYGQKCQFQHGNVDRPV